MFRKKLIIFKYNKSRKQSRKWEISTEKKFRMERERGGRNLEIPTGNIYRKAWFQEKESRNLEMSTKKLGKISTEKHGNIQKRIPRIWRCQQRSLAKHTQKSLANHPRKRLEITRKGIHEFGNEQMSAEKLG